MTGKTQAMLETLSDNSVVMMKGLVLSAPFYKAYMAIPTERRKMKRHLRKIKEKFKVEITISTMGVISYRTLVEDNPHYKVGSRSFRGRGTDLILYDTNPVYISPRLFEICK